MRTTTLVGITVGLALAVGEGVLCGSPNQAGKADQIDRLIKQLGAAQFAKREAAYKELEAIGEPAFPALRKAAAAGDDELRRRAEGLLIVGLIKQLGDPRFAKREAASRELETIGKPALPALRRAAMTGDTEIQLRAERLIQVIDPGAGKR